MPYGYDDEKEQKKRIDRVEEIAGYTFKNRELALQAITHPSAVEGDSQLSYERLEFLGDSIVGFTVALEAFKRYPELDEGILTKMRIAVVNGSFLTAATNECGLDECIIYGSSELSSQSRGHKSASEDVFEALTAALFLDGGMECAAKWVLDRLGDYIDPSVAKDTSNPKSLLQEYVQAKGGTVEYEIISTKGPSHAPIFVSQVSINGKVFAQGEGPSKKAAESAAAGCALQQFEN